MALELIAPAKLNLSLEITGRRPDGYHEIVTVMQTINLADHIRVDAAPSIEIDVWGEATRNVPLEGPHNLACAAAVALAAEAGDITLGARIELTKRIPAGMGLGGGSSDAAAVLRGLNRLWVLGFDDDRLCRVAATVGSDVAFFVRGGVALVTGRGEVVEPLPDMEPRPFTLFFANVDIADKTRRMYANLTPADITDGSRARAAAASLLRGETIADEDMVNAFDRHVGEAAPPLAGAMALCRDAGLTVLACGSGPGFFSPMPLDRLPGMLQQELERDWGVRAIAARSLGGAEATATREV